MKILVLGGTVFLGRHVVQAAIDDGHEVTLFNRGRRNPQLFAGVERLVGDRNTDMGALRGRRFDAVIDCCGYTPAQLARTAEVLGGDVPHYVFVSTISVYAAFAPGVPYDESAPIAAGAQGYGPLKARTEEAAEAAWPGRVAHVRPGLIVGPHDPTGRFAYWPARVARGAEVLAPGRPDRPTQFIDVRDLANWCLHLAKQRTTGAFNAVGPLVPMAAVLEACRSVTAAAASFVWVPDEMLVAHGVEPFTGLPLWIPENDAAAGGLLLADANHAAAAGLRVRPLIDTVRDTYEWITGDTEAVTSNPTTVTAEREAQLLAEVARLA